MKNGWTGKWGYQEAFAIPLALVGLGLGWQWVLGAIKPAAFAFPLNLIAGLLLLLSSVWLGLRGRLQQQRASFFASYKASIAAMACWLLLLLIMGFTRQLSPEQIREEGLSGLIHSLGWSSMLRSYPFILLYLYTLFCLGTAGVHYCIGLQKKPASRYLPFLLNHWGLYLALWAGLLGSQDLKRYTMQLHKESEYPEWRAAAEGEDVLTELPLAIQLQDFQLEEYPPKLFLINSKTGETLGGKHVEAMSCENVPAAYHREGLDIKILEYLPFSSPVVGRDSLRFVSFGSTGAVHAAKVRVQDNSKGLCKTGWVSAGSYMIPFRSLEIDSCLSLVMAEPEPRQYRSRLTVLSPTHPAKATEISVNHPLRYHGWYIYQLSYEQEKGRWSTASVLDLVYDPWMPVVYTGFALMLLGAFCLFIIPRPRPTELKTAEKERQDDA